MFWLLAFVHTRQQPENLTPYWIRAEGQALMGLMRKLSKILWDGQEGQDLTEYALLLILIALSAVAAMNNLATQISGVFSDAAASLQNAGSSS